MASPAHPGSIVVGVDGSPLSDLAVDWAAAEAHRHAVPLHLLHAVNLDWLVAASVISDATEHPAADEVLERAADRARAAFAGLRVTAQVTTGSAAHDLVRASADAREVVLGAHGRTRSHVPLGSIGTAVAMHAECPVVVARPYAAAEPASDRARGPVVVGVDGSALSARAIDFAVEHAALTGTSVVAVHAWWLDFIEGEIPTEADSADWQRARELMEVRVAESLAGRRERYPDVEVSPRFVHAPPGDALVEASAEASLLVVGARGRGGFSALLLGSVSRGVLMRAACPVAVVRPV
ncbi:MAG TPA: universal stress protein [Dermatophilaceae bacterium]|nr:universal stress protein [Dermatophilaceae bacterium]